MQQTNENLIKALELLTDLFGTVTSDEIISLTGNQIVQITRVLDHAKTRIEQLEMNQCKCAGSCGCSS